MDKLRYKSYKINSKNINNLNQSEYLNDAFKILDRNKRLINNNEYRNKLFLNALKIMDKPITTENFNGICSSMIEWCKNIKSVKKFLLKINENDSPFIKSIFEYLGFKDIKGYISLIKEYLIKWEKNGDLYKYEDDCNLLWKWSDYSQYLKINNEFSLLLWWPYVKCLPKEWLESFKLKEFIGKTTTKQGKYNGPDLIFYDKNFKEVGIEVTTYGQLDFVCSSKSVTNINKYFDKALQESQKYGDINNNFTEFLETINKIIQNKIDKNYKRVDRIYLLIIIKSYFAPPYAKELTRIIVNKNKEYRKKFAKIIIIPTV